PYEHTSGPALLIQAYGRAGVHELPQHLLVLRRRTVAPHHALRAAHRPHLLDPRLQPAVVAHGISGRTSLSCGRHLSTRCRRARILGTQSSRRAPQPQTARLEHCSRVTTRSPDCPRRSTGDTCSPKAVTRASPSPAP